MNMKFYRSGSHLVKAVKISQELLSNPDCLGGSLTYFYKDDTWVVETSQGQTGVEGDYLVFHEDETIDIQNGQLFEMHWTPVEDVPQRQILVQSGRQIAYRNDV